MHEHKRQLSSEITTNGSKQQFDSDRVGDDQAKYILVVFILKES